MIENIIVAGILCGAIFLLGRSLYRMMTDRKTGCGCSGDCANCTYVDGEKRFSYSTSGGHDQCRHLEPEADEKKVSLHKKEIEEENQCVLP